MDSAKVIRELAKAAPTLGSKPHEETLTWLCELGLAELDDRPKLKAVNGYYQLNGTTLGPAHLDGLKILDTLVHMPDQEYLTDMWACHFASAKSRGIALIRDANRDLGEHLKEYTPVENGVVAYIGGLDWL